MSISTATKRTKSGWNCDFDGDSFEMPPSAGRETPAFYGEKYHSSPACELDDIILAGSDEEQTVEEIKSKRRRYEDQARRYDNGERPTLLSARLNGPFNKESGWHNPWRRKPRAPSKVVEVEDWWQPGSEDMLFTREKVLKRAADHGLGYLTPQAALAWCKATAIAEAGQMLRSRPRKPSARDENTLEDERSQIAQLKLTRTVGSGESLVNKRNSSGGFISTAGKPLWLKGSYNSSNAPWTGNSIASPTPLPDLRIKRKGVPQKSHHDQVNSDFSVRPASSTSPRTLHGHKAPMFGSNPDGKRSVKELQGSDSSRQSLDTQRGPLADTGRSRRQHDEQPANYDSISVISFPYGSSTKESHLEHNSGLVNAPSQLATVRSTQMIHRGDRNNQNGTTETMETSRSSISIAHHQNDDSIGLGLEYDTPEQFSLRPEVIPSCGDLQKFQFVRKKKKTDRRVSGEDAEIFTLRSSNAAKETNVDNPSVTLDMNSCADDQREMRIRQPSHIQDSGVTPSVIKAGFGEEPSRLRVSSIIEPDGDEEWETTLDGTCHTQVDDNDDWETTLGTPYTQDQTSIMLNPLRPKRTSVEQKQQQQHHSSPRPSSQDGTTGISLIHEMTTRTARIDAPIASPETYITKISSPRERVTLVQDNVVTTLGSVTITPQTRATARMSRRRTISAILPGESSIEPKEVLVSSRNTSGTPGRPSTQRRVEAVLTKCPSPSTAEVVAQRDDHGFSVDQNDISTQSINTTPCHSPRRTDIQKISTQNLVETYESEPAPSDHLGQNLLPILAQKGDSNNVAEQDQDQRNLSLSCTSNIHQIACVGIEGGQQRSDTPVQLDFEIKRAGCSSTATPRVVGSNMDYNDVTAGVETDQMLRSLSASPSPSPQTSPASFSPSTKKSNVTPESRSPMDLNQSPWAIEAVDLPVVSSKLMSANTSASLPMSEDRGQSQSESDWQIFDPSLTLSTLGEKKPQDDFATPERVTTLLVKSKDSRRTLLRDPSSSQFGNPWNSSLRRPSSKKIKKRVSFGVFLSEAVNTDADPAELDIGENPAQDTPGRQGAPPELDHLDGTNDFIKRIMQPTRTIVAFEVSKQFRRMLPDKTASQLNSSPAPIEAMAEAFVNADQDNMKHSERSIQRNSRSPPLVATSPWQCAADGATLQEDSAYADAFREEEETFDIDAALGDANTFLEDWSVEAELKKSKELETMAAYESNGMKRRRLFGLF